MAVNNVHFGDLMHYLDATRQSWYLVCNYEWLLAIKSIQNEREETPQPKKQANWISIQSNISLPVAFTQKLLLLRERAHLKVSPAFSPVKNKQIYFS